MARYRWDINELKQRKQQLILMAAESKDPIRIKEIESSIKTYEGMLQEYNINNCIEEQWEEEEVDAKLLVRDFLKDEYSTLSPEIVEIICAAMDILAKYDITAANTDYSTLIMTDDELMQIVTKFYEAIPNKAFRRRFRVLTNPNKHLVHMQFCKNGTYDDAGGFCDLDAINHIPYANILRTNTICDIIIAIHEIMHMIIRENEIPLYMDTSKEIYGEYEGNLSDFMAFDFLKKAGFNQKEINLFEKNSHFIIDNMAMDVTVANQLAKTASKDGSFTIKPIKEYFKARDIVLPMNRKNFGHFLSQDILGAACAVISYLVSLDLYSTYKLDPEKGIYLLNKVQTLPGEHIRKELGNLEFTFFEDGFKNLDKKCKQITKQKN